MLNWFKRIFTKKQPVEELTLDFHTIPDWIASQKTVKHAELQPHLDDFKQRLAEKQTELRTHIEALRTARLMNQDIPERAKQLADGNRDEFTRRATSLADSIPIPETLDALPTLFTTVTNAIRDFVEGTVRPLHVLNEFHANEAKALANDVADIERLTTTLHELHTGTAVTLSDTLLAEHHHITKLTTHRDTLSREITQARTTHAAIQEQITTLRTRITDLEHGPLYAEFLQLKTRIQDIQNEKRRIRQSILDWFGPMNSVLLVYESDKHHAPIAKRYLTDPAGALLEDASLRILTLLRDAAQKLAAGHLDVKDKKREKVTEHLANLTTLQTFQIDYRKTGTEEDNLIARLRTMPVTQQLVTLRKQIHDAEQNLPSTERAFADREKKLPDVRAAIETYQAKLAIYAGTPVTIRLGPSAPTRQSPATASPR